MGSILSKSYYLNIVRQTLISENMIQPDDAVILAVSGGPDSVALTHIMFQLKEEFACRLIIAHLDHCLRNESGLDFEFVKALAESLGVGFFAKRFDLIEFAAKKKIGVEQAGRIIRYDFLEDTRIKFGANKIATAHNADDVIETLLFRLFQGSSLTGLSGIPLKRGNIIRPLLRLHKSQILEFLTREEKNYVVDKTNFNSETDRNFVRNRVIPTIIERFPNFRGPLLRTARLIQEDERHLDAMAREIYPTVIGKRQGWFEIDIQKINSLPPVISSRIVRRVLFDLSAPHTRWTRFHIDLILTELKLPKPYVSLKLPLGLFFLKDYGTARISTFEEKASFRYCFTVVGPGRVEIPGTEMCLDFRMIEDHTFDAEPPFHLDKVYFDADSITFPFELRPFEPGDRITPWGRHSPVKIKKLFIDSKIARSDRYKLPMVFKEDSIVWVPGLRRCAGYGINRSTKSVLEISLLRKKLCSASYV